MDDWLALGELSSEEEKESKEKNKNKSSPTKAAPPPKISPPRKNKDDKIETKKTFMEQLKDVLGSEPKKKPEGKRGASGLTIKTKEELMAQFKEEDEAEKREREMERKKREEDSEKEEEEKEIVPVVDNEKKVKEQPIKKGRVFHRSNNSKPSEIESIQEKDSNTLFKELQKKAIDNNLAFSDGGGSDDSLKYEEGPFNKPKKVERKKKGKDDESKGDEKSKKKKKAKNETDDEIKKAQAKVRKEKKEEEIISESGEEEEMDENDIRRQTTYPNINVPPKYEAKPFLVSKNKPDVYLNSNISQYLRPYQKEGVKWLYELWENKQGGILGDDMGLGKTIQIIAFLTAVLKKKSNGTDSIKKYQGAPILLIVPNSLVENWKNEFKIWGAFAVEDLVTGVGAEKCNRILDRCRHNKVEILLTTVSKFIKLKNQVDDICWKMIIMDEFHQFRNPKAKTTLFIKSLKSDVKIGLTGTLQQNNHTDTWCLVDIVRKNLLYDLNKFNKSVKKVILNAHKADANDETKQLGAKREAMLTRRVAKVHLRREKTMAEVKDQLPLKTERVIFCSLTSKQKKAYRKILAGSDVKLILNKENLDNIDRWKMESVFWNLNHTEMVIDEDGIERQKSCYSKTCPSCQIFSVMDTLRKTAQHLDLIRVDGKTGDKKRERQSKIAHLALDADDVDINHSFVSATLKADDSGKVKACKNLLQKAKREGNKVLLFSRSTAVLDILESQLNSWFYKYVRLDGSTNVQKRQKIVDDFNTDKSIEVFLISTKAGGLGLNLQSANTVIIFDPCWNPSSDAQAMDRAYRLGQAKDVEVFRLISIGTIDEITYLRQIYKTQQSKSGVEGNTDIYHNFTGVQGDSEQHGELFGAENLLKFNENGFTNEIIRDGEERDITKEMAEIAKAYDRESKLVEKKKIKKGADDDDPEDVVRNMLDPEDFRIFKPELLMYKSAAKNNRKTEIKEESSTESESDVDDEEEESKIEEEEGEDGEGSDLTDSESDSDNDMKDKAKKKKGLIKNLKRKANMLSDLSPSIDDGISIKRHRNVENDFISKLEEFIDKACVFLNMQKLDFEHHFDSKKTSAKIEAKRKLKEVMDADEVDEYCDYICHVAKNKGNATKEVINL